MNEEFMPAEKLLSSVKADCQMGKYCHQIGDTKTFNNKYDFINRFYN